MPIDTENPGFADTLSTAQWSKLQSLFEQALQADAEDRARLLERILTDDTALGASLAAMLSAHEQWRDRTDAARDNLQRQAHRSALLANGETIGPYRILGVLGEGGMGVVYRAERADGEVALTVAIKVLRPGALDAATRERFRRERDLLAGLSHPHIARLFDAGVGAGDQPYFVMEYVQGATLTLWCDERRLDLRSRLRLFLDVCDAVEYAHRQLVLHRDIKPGNVLVDAAGVAKLIDFGIAKPIALDDAAMVETATAQRYFSPANVAPEQLRGGRMGVACDVYQLGTLLYELLCGRPVFEMDGRTARAMEEAILHQAPVAPSARARGGDASLAQARGASDGATLARQLTGDLDEIVLLALRKEPARRYASVGQLVDDVERHLGLLPVRARGSHRGYRAGLFVKRHWRSLALVTTALTAIIAFVTVLTLQSRQLQRERDHAVTEQQRAEQATKFLIGVFKAADPKESLSRTTPIAVVLENGRRKLDTELSGQPRLDADLSYALAAIYQDIEDFANAQKYARHALQVRQSLAPETLDVADSLGQLAATEQAASNCKTAVADGAHAVTLYRKLGVGVARSIDAEAGLIQCEEHERTPQYGRDRMLALLKALQGDPGATALQIASQELRVADYLAMADDYAGSERYTRSAAGRLERSPWKDSAFALALKLELANDLSIAKKYEQADAAFAQLVTDYRRIFGANSLDYARVVFGRGANYADWGHSREAETDYLEVLRLRMALSKDPTMDQGVVAFNLADLYVHWLHDPALAGPYYDQAVHLAEAAVGPRDTNTLIFKAARATWYERVGRLQEAKAESEALLPLIPVSEEQGVQTRLTLASVLAQTGQHAAADAQLAACAKAIAGDPSFADMKADLDRVRAGGQY